MWSKHTFDAGGGRTVMVLILDGRYHKTPYPTWPVRVRSLDPASDFLGEEQWAWLKGLPLTPTHCTLDPEPRTLAN